MTKNQFLLQDIKNILERPLYNSLEVGFRHSPLSLRETVQRYEEAILELKLLVEELEIE